MKSRHLIEKLAVWRPACALFGALACNASPSPTGSTEASARPFVAVRAPPPAAPVVMPGAMPQDVAPVAAEAVAASATIKSTGDPGDRLEGDVYVFKVVSTRSCEGSAKTVGVEVVIEAKSKLAVSPRDVVLNKGGVAFNAGLDFERKLPGCFPLLKIGWLQKGESARGFVLFDLPSPPPTELMLVYQPTRWGGAGLVTVQLHGWTVR